MPMNDVTASLCRRIPLSDSGTGLTGNTSRHVKILRRSSWEMEFLLPRKRILYLLKKVGERGELEGGCPLQTTPHPRLSRRYRIQILTGCKNRRCSCPHRKSLYRLNH